MKEDARPKWRGIPTTQTPKNELEPVTIINRLKQKSLSLPRIDDKKRWAGFAGLAGTSRKLAQLIPESLVYVEPFAGTAKPYQELLKIKYKTNAFILNDKSKFIYKWLKKEFKEPRTMITNHDFVTCMRKWDTKDSVFVIDFPWYKSYYDQQFASFNRTSVTEYSTEVLELCKKLKGKFFIVTRKENNVMRKAPYNHITIKSEYVVSGHYPEIMVTTNQETK